MTETGLTVLIVDDEEMIRQVVSMILAEAGHATVEVPSGERALAAVRQRPFDAALLDLQMPGMDGFATLDALKAVDPEMPVLILTGEGSVQAAVRALEQGACDFLEKPIRQTDLVRAVDRAIERNRKELARPHHEDKAAADLNAAILTTLTIVRNELTDVADVETDLAELPPVDCHLGAIGQVLLSMFINAAHAIRETVGESGRRGTIRVSTRQVGGSVLISVRDSGCGMPREVAAKIFEPFFTTNEVDRGTGQGLAIARAVVVERHGGSLTFETEVGRGTTFHIRLPIGVAAAVVAGEIA